MTSDNAKIGWIGVGRMGVVIASRLLNSDYELAVWNRTKSKTEPLAQLGARIVDKPSDLGTCDVVITMVSSSDVFELVTLGQDGLLCHDGPTPGILVDASTISEEASRRVRTAAEKVGTQLVAAPVSGNPKVAKAGKLTVVASGPKEAFDTVEPILATFGQGVTYVGDDDAARLVKICHNLLLGIVSQTLAEITVLAERGGVQRSAFLEFINSSVMGSVFSRYKTPAMVNLDYTPTFTGHLLRKDFELGLQAARDLNVPLPTAALVHQIVITLIGQGLGEGDFIRLLELEANSSNHQLVAENIDVSDGLEAIDELGREA